MLRIMDVLRRGVSNLCAYVLASSSDSSSVCRESGSEGDCIVTPTSCGSDASQSCGSEPEKKKKSSRSVVGGQEVIDAQSLSRKFKGCCFFCQRPGHKERSCHAKKKLSIGLAIKSQEAQKSALLLLFVCCILFMV